MQEYLLQLGFTEKEASVYLALLELGSQPASVLAKKTKFPKATIHFLCDNLVKRGYVRRSHKGRIQYFYADPEDLKKAKKAEIDAQNKALDEAIPLLLECKSPFTSPPKITFYEGIEGCQKAYMKVTESETKVLEFAAHNDLLKMGEKYMDHFLDTRVKNGVKIDVICPKNATHDYFLPLNKKQKRVIRMFSAKNKGEFFSSIDVFENKVLLLNLYHDAFAILIENQEFAETMKTIFNLAWDNPDNKK